MAADPITADAAAELLNYDLSDDDPFNDNPPRPSRDDKAMLSPRGTKRKTGDEEGNALGLDEEVKITKKRKPAVKLDEARLLSAPGIPKLREIARSSVGVTRKLRMKGKGHEFSDVARLLNFYQLWLDGLYPRARFADGLQLIEKVGHTKRMQVMRREWIDEGKPGYIKPGTELVESILNDEFPISGHAGHNGQPMRMEAGVEPQDDDAGMFFPSPSKPGQQEPSGGADPDDDDDLDELDALMAAHENQPNPSAASSRQGGEDDGDDDLDAIMAEEESRRIPQPRATIQLNTDVDDEPDDLDALHAEQHTHDQGRTPVAPAQPASSPRLSSQLSGTKRRKQAIFDDSDSEGDDDLDALLAEQSARQRKSTPPTSPLPANNEADSLPDQAKVTGPDQGSSQAGITKTFSSSPMRKEKPYSSSPLPNPEEADLDALLGDEIM